MAPFPHVAPLKQSGKGEKAKMWQMPSSLKCGKCLLLSNMKRLITKSSWKLKKLKPLFGNNFVSQNYAYENYLWLNFFEQLIKMFLKTTFSFLVFEQKKQTKLKAKLLENVPKWTNS